MVKNIKKVQGQVLVNNVMIKNETLHQLNTTESAAIDELLVPVTGAPFLLNKLVEDINDEGAEAVVHKAECYLEIRQDTHTVEPQMIEIAIVKCNHGTTFTESVGAYPSVGGVIGVAMSSSYAWKSIGHKYVSIPLNNRDEIPPSEYTGCARTTRFKLNITRWLRMILNNHGDGAFYPNADDDEYRIVIIRKGAETAGTVTQVFGNFRIEWSSLDNKSFDSI